MGFNPCAKFLGDLDPLEVIANTPTKLNNLLERMPDEQIELSPPNAKWTAREIVAHLADCETVYCFRLRQTLAEGNPTLQPWDEKKWAARYANLDVDAALDLFESARTWNLLFLDELTLNDRQRPATHPERGAMTLWTIVETIAGHDLNHLAQLERLAPRIES
jgi:uncharacterized damage-inducible protein DinB